ncbi:hypothetical protein IF650_03655 [Cellulosimicrobium terreum]|nr:hypothetical protein [Cellulosimicrobium terreum]
MLPMRLHPAHRATAATLAAALTVALLAACSSPDDESPTDPAPSGTATDDATDAPLTADEACAAMYTETDPPLERSIGDALVGVSEGLDAETAGAMTTVGIQLGGLSTRVPPEFDDAVAQIRVPFLQLQETLDTGTEESVDLDVASARDGLVAYRGLCEDLG